MLDEPLYLYHQKTQNSICKSPMEAELIGLTNNLGLVKLFKEFVDFVTGKDTETQIVY